MDEVAAGVGSARNGKQDERDQISRGLQTLWASQEVCTGQSVISGCLAGERDGENKSTLMKKMRSKPGRLQAARREIAIIDRGDMFLNFITATNLIYEGPKRAVSDERQD